MALRVSGTHLDITERMKVREDLRKSEEKYRTLFESSRDGIVYTDMEGKILDANQAYLEMVGYSLEEVRQLTYQQLTPERWRAADENVAEKQILARGYCDEYEKEYIRKDGTAFPINVRGWLTTDHRGRPVGLWGIIRDITDRKSAEE